MSEEGSSKIDGRGSGSHWRGLRGRGGSRAIDELYGTNSDANDQGPMTEAQGMTNVQGPMTIRQSGHSAWTLDIGHSLGLGHWASLIHTSKISRTLSRKIRFPRATASVSLMRPGRTKSSARLSASTLRYMLYLGSTNSSL